GNGELAIDKHFAAVVAGEVELVLSLSLDFEETLEAHGHVLDTMRLRQIEAATLTGCDGLHGVEVWDLVPGALVIRPGEIDRGRENVEALQQKIRNLGGLLAGQQMGHASRRTSRMRIVEECLETGDRVSGREISKRHGCRENPIGSAIGVASPMAGDAADFV